MAEKILGKLLQGKHVVHWGRTDKSGICTVPKGQTMQTQIIFSVQHAEKTWSMLSKPSASAFCKEFSSKDYLKLFRAADNLSAKMELLFSTYHDIFYIYTYIYRYI